MRYINIIRLPHDNVRILFKKNRKRKVKLHASNGAWMTCSKVEIFEITRYFTDCIEQEHRFHGPSWKNTDASGWCVDSWQIAKCFMPPDGYLNVHIPQETDFNGLISIILNCKRFDKHLPCLQSQTNVFEKVSCNVSFFLCFFFCFWKMTSFTLCLLNGIYIRSYTISPVLGASCWQKPQTLS